MTHKRHKTAPDRAPEEAMKSKKPLEIVEKEGVWIEGDDAWIEDTQGEAWGMSSDSSSIVLLDGEEEDGTHTFNQLYFNMILSKGIADWYESVAEKRPQTNSLATTQATHARVNGEHHKMQKEMDRLYWIYSSLL